MTEPPDSWTQVRALFDRAADAGDEERRRLLEAAPAEVRRQVEALLEQDARDSAFPEHIGELGAAGALPLLYPGERVGPYRLVRALGKGGMGIVFEAEQDRPRRRVALKTLRAELVDGELLRRFHNEVQLLGQLEHPGIARIYDAGSYADRGRECPYYAMELVEGARTLLAHAATEDLGRRARLELFVEACEAIGYGHRKGVIHRDLKPGNLLVDAHGRVKVIDFGLARPLEPAPLGVDAIDTHVGDVFGTLPYMSPEHVSGRSFAIDTRSDVYALGCVLCELLTGRTPRDLRASSLSAAMRRIETEDARVPDGLERELGWIVLHATQRDPARRYSGAAELAADVRHYLRREPLAAGPPSRWYAARAFVRRHRALLAAAAAVLVALAVGLVRAESSARAAAAARDQAEFDARLAENVNWFLGRLFRSAHAYAAGGEARVADVLEVGDRDLTNVADPHVRAVLAGVVGEGHLSLGALERAGERLREAVELAREHLPPDSTYRLHNEVLWADWLEQVGRVRESRERSLALLPALRSTLGPAHEDTQYLLTNLAVCEDKLGLYAEAEARLREQYPIVVELEGERSVAAAMLLHRLGGAVCAQERYEEGLELLEEAHDIALELRGEDDLLVATIRMDLGGAAFGQGDLDAAEALFLEARDAYERLGGTRRNRADVRLRLAELALARGRLDEAARRLARAAPLLGDEPGPYAVAHRVLSARLALAEGAPDRAAELHAEATRMAGEAFGDAPPASFELDELRERIDAALAAEADGVE